MIGTTSHGASTPPARLAAQTAALRPRLLGRSEPARDTPGHVRESPRLAGAEQQADRQQREIAGDRCPSSR